MGLPLFVCLIRDSETELFHGQMRTELAEGSARVTYDWEARESRDRALEGSHEMRSAPISSRNSANSMRNTGVALTSSLPASGQSVSLES